MTKPRKKIEIPPLTEEEAKRQEKIMNEATREFVGIFDELEKAVGMLAIGRLIGWRALYLIHSRKTIVKYEKILGIKVMDEFPERGPMAHKSIALGLVDTVGNFWKAVSGEESVANRRELVK